MKRLIKPLSVIVLAAILLSMLTICFEATAASGLRIQYTFTGADAAKPGFAQGSISVSASGSADNGSYSLYWADTKGKLDGYSAIGTVTLSGTTAKTVTMPAYTFIPNGATRVIALPSSGEGSSAAGDSTYSLRGSFNGWGEEKMFKTSDSNVDKITLKLSAETYTFKVCNNGSTWYGSNNTVNDTVSNLKMSSSAGNCSLTVSGGYYTFAFNKTSAALTITRSDSDPDSNGDDTPIASDKIVGEFAIPGSKQSPYSDSDILYSYEQLSDIHMDHTGGGYPFDTQHFEAALSTAVDHDVDYIITSGDMITNNDYGHDADWKLYTETLSKSDYVNPIYEAIGNHEIWESVASGTKEFAQATGLGNDAAAMNASKGYYEMTEPKTGDHFIFMALEGGMDVNALDQFSAAQMSWLKGLLEKYDGDGKNIFILEHALFDRWGAGDIMSNPIYGGPLSFSFSSTTQLKGLLQKYKNIVFSTGHTHVALAEQCNYSNENGTSATHIHNSSVGCPKNINAAKDDFIKNHALDNTEGYIVDVYADHTVFNGINLYYNEILPACSYYVKGNTSLLGAPNPTNPKPSTPTASQSAVPSSPIASVPVTTAPPAAGILGDADGNSRLAVTDATLIQKHTAKLETIKSANLTNSDVSGDGNINITDATLIQKKLALLITAFPAEQKAPKAAVNADSAGLKTLITQASSYLTKNYLYASYDSYQAVKKLVYEYRNKTNLSAAEADSAYAKLSSAYTYLQSIVSGTAPVTPTNPVTPGTVPGGNEVTLMFTNNENWTGTISAYVWSSSEELTAWPGTEMTSSGINSYGQKVYSIAVDSSKYSNVIFTNGTNQTVDIPVDGSLGYYIDGMDGDKYTCATYPIV